MPWARWNFSYHCLLLYNFFPLLSDRKWCPVGKFNSSHIWVVKVLPCHIREGSGEGTEGPVKRNGH